MLHPNPLTNNTIEKFIEVAKIGQLEEFNEEDGLVENGAKAICAILKVLPFYGNYWAGWVSGHYVYLDYNTGCCLKPNEEVLSFH